MILNESEPEKSLYVFGASIIDYLKNDKKVGTYNFIKLFDEIQQKLNISRSQFLMTLDWLYVIGIIYDLNDNEIILCF